MIYAGPLGHHSSRVIQYFEASDYFVPYVVVYLFVFVCTYLAIV